MLHSGSRALLVLLLSMLPVGAQAALTLTSVALAADVGGTNGTDSSFKVTFTIAGTEIQTATVTPQGIGSTAITLPCTAGTTCTATLTLTQTQFNQLFPTSGQNYKIDLTQVSGTNTITSTVSFTLQSVPSPAISFPTSSTPISPTSLVVTFSACASCTVATHAVLTLGSTELASQDLPASSTSWTPGVTLAPSTTGFAVAITHKTTGTLSPAPTYTLSGTSGSIAYTFTSDVTHADSVAFSTGFAQPVGAFCVILIDTSLSGPGTSCPVLDATALGILDTSGLFATTLGGIPIVYQVALGPKGNVTGTAHADLDGDATFETSAPLTGRVRGKDGALRQRLRARFVNDSLDARLQLRILEEANLANLTPSGGLTTLLTEQLRGKQGGAKVDVTSSSAPVILNPPIGWRLDFTLTAGQKQVPGQLQAAGSTISLQGNQTFDTATNLSDIRLSSGGAQTGVQLRLKKLVVDGATIQSGQLKLRAFGQSTSGLLP